MSAHQSAAKRLVQSLSMRFDVTQLIHGMKRNAIRSACEHNFWKLFVDSQH